MASVVDTLVTRFLADSAGYQKGSRDVLHATEDMISGLGRGVSHATKLFLGLGVAAGAGILAIGKKALDSAVSFDALNRSLIAITKSAARAQEILKFGDKLALPSIFEAKDLDQTALTLEAFGLRTEKFLPVVEKLGTIFGGTVDSLREFADALGMISSGRTGRGFESLARAGISREQLSVKFGLQFDKGGEYKGDVKKALDAIEREVNDRFGRLSQEMASSPRAMLGSLGDVGGRALRALGNSALTVLMPALQMVYDRLFAITQDGTIQKITDGFAKLFSGQALGTGLVKAIDWLVISLQKMPGWLDKNKQLFHSIGESAKTISSVFATSALPLLNGLLHAVERLANAFTSLPKGIQSAVASIWLINKATGGLVGTILQGLAKIGAAKIAGSVAGAAVGAAGKTTEIGLLTAIEANTAIMAGKSAVGNVVGPGGGATGTAVVGTGSVIVGALTKVVAPLAVIAGSLWSIFDTFKTANDDLNWNIQAHKDYLGTDAIRKWDQYERRHRADLRKKLGREPTDDEFYSTLSQDDPLYWRWQDKKHHRGIFKNDSQGGGSVAAIAPALVTTGQPGGVRIGPGGKLIVPQQGIEGALAKVGAVLIKPILERLLVQHDSTDLNKQLLGGGHLSREATSDQQLAGITGIGTRRRGGGGKLDRGLEMIREAIGEMVSSSQHASSSRMRQHGF